MSYIIIILGLFLLYFIMKPIFRHMSSLICNKYNFKSYLKILDIMLIRVGQVHKIVFCDCPAHFNHKQFKLETLCLIYYKVFITQHKRSYVAISKIFFPILGQLIRFRNIFGRYLSCIFLKILEMFSQFHNFFHE